MAAPSKNVGLFVWPPLILGFLFAVEIAPWLANREHPGVGWTALTVISAIAWIITVWWALHHLLFQIAALVPPEAEPDFGAPAKPIRITLFYVTCDDFNPICCESCVGQKYPPGALRVVICDDSSTPQFREAIDKFQADHKEVVLARRDGRSGHKAGNLNHAFDKHVDKNCDWVVIVDADQWLEESYLTKLAPALAAQPAEVAFVQAGREPIPESVLNLPPPTEFQKPLQSEVRLFFERDMAWRNRFGFLPFLGHGGAVRAKAWREDVRFPEFVSEDFAFGMEVRKHDLWGARVDHVRSAEAYPPDFGAFVVRLGKFASGAGELWFRRLPAFLFQSKRTEWWDAMMMLGTYALIPIVLVNLVASAYLCHALWADAVAVLPPRLPYLFFAMFLFSLAVLVSVSEPAEQREIKAKYVGKPLSALMSLGSSFGLALRHWFWALAVYGAAMPYCAWRFLKALVVRPAFQRTPKAPGSGPKLQAAAVLTGVTGLAMLAAAVVWWSPFSPVLAATAIAQVLFPSFRWLHENSARGSVSRGLVYLPGTSFLIGLFWMWLWATT